MVFAKDLPHAKEIADGTVPIVQLLNDHASSLVNGSDRRRGVGQNNHGLSTPVQQSAEHGKMQILAAGPRGRPTIEQECHTREREFGVQSNIIPTARKRPKGMLTRLVQVAQRPSHHRVPLHASAGWCLPPQKLATRALLCATVTALSEFQNHITAHRVAGAYLSIEDLSGS